MNIALAFNITAKKYQESLNHTFLEMTEVTVRAMCRQVKTTSTVWCSASNHPWRLHRTMVVLLSSERG